jgi:hypothetical protein
MGRLFFTLMMVAGLGYGGLYFYYGVSVKQAVEQRLDDLGLDDLAVKRVHFDPTAPLREDTRVAADIEYGGGDATVELRVIGHPVFSDDVTLELQGLQGLRLRFGG